MDKGWIKLHRQLLEWEWYSDINVRILFLHCLLLANHEDKKWRGIEIKKGQFVTSIEHLSNCGLSFQQVRTCLKKLKSTNELTIKSTSQNTIITINNWELYQANNTQDNKQITNEQQTNNKQITTNKNIKNDKNEKNIINAVNKDIFCNKFLTETQKVIKEVYNQNQLLSNQNRAKILELGIDYPDYLETLPDVLKFLKKLKWDKIGFKPSVSWLFENDNYVKVRNNTWGQVTKPISDAQIRYEREREKYYQAHPEERENDIIYEF